MDPTRDTWLPAWIAVALMLAVGAGIAVFGGTLVPTIGIITVGAALFLPPRRTALVIAIGATLALLLIIGLGIDRPWARFGNLALASCLALLASWTIEQRMRAIRRLSREQASVFLSVPDGLAVLDRQGTLLQCNAALTELVPHAVVGMRLHPHLGHVLSDETACRGGCLLDSPGTVGSAAVDGEFITRGNTRVAVEYTAAEIDDTSVVVSVRDVTALKETERHRRILLEAAVRQGEQRELLKAFGAPEFVHLPSIPGLQLDLYSDPGTTGADLVDVTSLPDGRVMVIMADAVGEGLRCLPDAWKALYIARAYLAAGVTIDDVITATAQTLASETEALDVSLMVALLDPRTGQLEFIGGGHPPALLVRANGATEWLDSVAPALGQDNVEPVVAGTRQLGPGDSLVVYTDGVIDGTLDAIQGLSALRSAAAALRRRSAHSWATTVVQAVRKPDQKSGNATLLLVRLDSPGRHTTATR